MSKLVRLVIILMRKGPKTCTDLTVTESLIMKNVNSKPEVNLIYTICNGNDYMHFGSAEPQKTGKWNLFNKYRCLLRIGNNSQVTQMLLIEG